MNYEKYYTIHTDALIWNCRDNNNISFARIYFSLNNDDKIESLCTANLSKIDEFHLIRKIQKK